MTDDLTEVLHHGADGLPPPRHQPAELRHDAEHRRRVRRATGGTLVALAVVLGALASGVDGRDETAPRPAPARTPTPTAPGPTGSRTFALADQAVLTGKDWHDVTGGPGSRSAIDTRQAHACTPDPRAQGSPTETQAVTYRESQRPGTQLNEYVMRYADVRRRRGRVRRGLQQLRRLPGPGPSAYDEKLEDGTGLCAAGLPAPGRRGVRHRGAARVGHRLVLRAGAGRLPARRRPRRQRRGRHQSHRVGRPEHPHPGAGPGPGHPRRAPAVWPDLR